MSSISILQKKWVKKYLMFCRNNHRKMSQAQGVDLLIRRRIDATHLTVQRDLWQPLPQVDESKFFSIRLSRLFIAARACYGLANCVCIV